MSGPKGKALTRELVFNKTRSDNIQAIKNLNLWGNELEDLKLIQGMPNLQVISLSVNCISSLKDFANCRKLQELYLRKNYIKNITEIKHLLKLPFLKILWLQDNPCASIPKYRQIVIHHLPNLIKLDNNVISQDEKILCRNLQFQLNGMAQQLSKPNCLLEEVQREIPETSNSRRTRNLSDYSKQLSNYRQDNKESIYNNSNHNEPGSSSQQLVMNCNKNILIAVLSLMKELDTGSLQIVKKQSRRMIHQK